MDRKELNLIDKLIAVCETLENNEGNTEDLKKAKIYLSNIKSKKTVKIDPDLFYEGFTNIAKVASDLTSSISKSDALLKKFIV